MDLRDPWAGWTDAQRLRVERLIKAGFEFDNDGEALGPPEWDVSSVDDVY
jgi:hypothetical protein